MLPASYEDAFDGADIAVVPAVGESDMVGVGQQVIGRIKIDPARLATIQRHPGVRRVGADKPRLAFRRSGPEVSADIASSESQRPETPELHVGEVLAYSAPLSKNPPTACSFRGPCVVFEVLIDTPVNNAMGKFNLPMRTEPYRVVFVAERCGCG